jgi:hypothetical protein
MTQELFVAGLVPDLPVIDGHQVTESELRAVTQLVTPYFIGMGPPNPLIKQSGDKARRRDARRRANAILPDVLKTLKPGVVDGDKQVVGFFLTAIFLTYVLPALITWIIERLITWSWDHAWSEVSAMAPAAMPSGKDD